MGFLYRRSDGRRRRPVAMAAVAFLAAAGTLVVTAAPAQAAITGAVVREGDFVFVPSFGTASGAAICDPGEVVIGGGVLVMSFDTTVRLSTSFANASNRWFVLIANPTSDFQEVHVRALCARNVAGYSQTSLAPVSLPPGSSGNIGTATCPNGAVAIGGGFTTNANDFDRPKIKTAATYADSSNPAAWNVEMRNDSLGFYSGGVQAICTTQTNRTSVTGKVLSVGADATLYDTDDCGTANSVAVAGGYRTVGDFPTSVVTGFLPTPGWVPQWKINLSNPDSVIRRVLMLHACLPM